MRSSWTGLCASLVGAAVLAGCGGGQDRTAIDHATNQPKQNQQIAISGCLGSGIGNDEYMLTGAHLAPLSEQPSDAASTTAIPLTPNTQIRVAMNDQDQLDTLMGQKVTVTGMLSDDGRNTIGTSGTGQNPATGQAASRDDQSQAATKQHYSNKVAKEAGPIGQRSMNNGTFPEITVTKISGTGEKCVNWQDQDK